VVGAAREDDAVPRVVPRAAPAAARLAVSACRGEVAFPRKTMLCLRRLPPNSLLCIAPCRQREAASLKGVQQRAKQRRTLSSLAPSARRRRPGTNPAKWNVYGVGLFLAR